MIFYPSRKKLFPSGAKPAIIQFVYRRCDKAPAHSNTEFKGAKSLGIRRCTYNKLANAAIYAGSACANLRTIR